ncbi:hypothetical protein SSCG_01739 [Streptomyces clavuligerus]|nr:hypothetical protein SSCG_01739 [Streptomyces clavuligerus]
MHYGAPGADQLRYTGQLGLLLALRVFVFGVGHRVQQVRGASGSAPTTRQYAAETDSMGAQGRECSMIGGSDDH